jgi:hypothetical protein
MGCITGSADPLQCDKIKENWDGGEWDVRIKTFLQIVQGDREIGLKII